MKHPAQHFRLVQLSLAAKITVTAFLALIGFGYLVAAYKINLWHNAADGVAGMSSDDVRAVYHGLEKIVTSEMREALPSPMLTEVGEGGSMRKHLLEGGETAERALIAWLEQGAEEEAFARAGLVQPGDPSARDVIASQCVDCHNPAGDEPEIAYATGPDAEPDYALVAVKAVGPLGPPTTESSTVVIEPIAFRELVHVTHAHILSIPMFALAVAALFLHTGLPAGFKLLVAPLPMVATCVDIGCWWLARSFEPAIFGILLGGAVFGAGLGLQIVCTLGSMWFGRKPAENAHA